MLYVPVRISFSLRVLLLSFTVISLCLVAPHDALAKKKSKKKKSSAPVVEAGDYRTTNVTITVGKKKNAKELSFEVACLDTVGGEVKTQKGKLVFWSYQALKNKAKKQVRNSRSSKAKKKNLSKLQKLGKLQKASQAACASSDEGGVQDPDPDGPEQTVSFAPYTGPFGEEQARILFDRFCFGGTPEQINLAVAEGLDKTIDRLLKYQDEPWMNSAMDDIACDRYLKSEESENEEECDARNPNDFRVDGFRQALYFRILNSSNCFFNRLAMFLHDEKLAASTIGLPTEKKHLVKEHLKNLDRAARTGDYTQYMRDMTNDGLVAFFNLDLGSNNKFAPNENFAREFWEILTTGASDEDGAPLYNVLDIANSALAFTGGGWQRIDIDLGNNETARVDYPSYSLLSHAPGTKTVFFGTDYEAQVDDKEDVLQATKKHPYLARHISRELLQEFLVPNPSRASIGALAKTLRDADYNLHDAMKLIMKSEDLYDAQNRKNLLKHSWDFLFGFLRATKYPIDHREIDSYLSELGEQIFDSPSIFGWDTDKLNSERYVLERRNVVISMMRYGKDSLAERGYSLYDIFAADLPFNQLPERALVEKVSNMLGVRLNAEQRTLAEEYLNYTYNACDSDSEAETYGCRRCTYSTSSSNPDYCDESVEFYRRRDGIDIHPEGGFETKLQGLISMLVTSPEYLTK